MHNDSYRNYLMKSHKRLLVATVLGMAMTLAAGNHGAGAADAPAAASKTGAPRQGDPKIDASKRTADQVVKDLRDAGDELRNVLTSPAVLFDARKRTEAAPKAVPTMKKMIALFAELATIDPQQKVPAQLAHNQLT